MRRTQEVGDNEGNSGCDGERVEFGALESRIWRQVIERSQVSWGLPDGVSASEGRKAKALPKTPTKIVKSSEYQAPSVQIPCGSQFLATRCCPFLSGGLRTSRRNQAIVHMIPLRNV